MIKRNKLSKKVNANVVGKKRGSTKHSEAFKKLMVRLMISLLTMSLLNVFHYVLTSTKTFLAHLWLCQFLF